MGKKTRQKKGNDSSNNSLEDYFIEKRTKTRKRKNRRHIDTLLRSAIVQHDYNALREVEIESEYDETE